MIQSDFHWGDYLYDGIEVMLFTVRGNLKSFFNMGVPDDVELAPFYYLDFLAIIHNSLYVDSRESFKLGQSTFDRGHNQHISIFTLNVSVRNNGYYVI